LSEPGAGGQSFACFLQISPFFGILHADYFLKLMEGLVFLPYNAAKCFLLSTNTYSAMVVRHSLVFI